MQLGWQPTSILLAPGFGRRQQWLDQRPKFVINNRRAHPWFQLFRWPRLRKVGKSPGIGIPVNYLGMKGVS